MFTKLYFFFIVIVLPIILIVVNLVVRKTGKPHRNQLTRFECGFDPFSNARTPFSLHFFLLGVIFIIFDLEIILLIPYPLLTNINIVSIIPIVITFLIILYFGTIHEWNEGSLAWVLTSNQNRSLTVN